MMLHQRQQRRLAALGPALSLPLALSAPTVAAAAATGAGRGLVLWEGSQRSGAAIGAAAHHCEGVAHSKAGLEVERGPLRCEPAPQRLGRNKLILSRD